MRRHPWHLALRADRRAILTAAAVALGAAFALVSITVPTALRSEAVSAEGALATQDLIVSSPGAAPFAPPPMGQGWLAVLLAEAQTTAGERVRLVAFEGAGAPNTSADVARPTGPRASDALDLETPALRLAWGEPISAAHVPRGFIVVHPSVARAVEPDLAPDRVSYLVLPPGDAAAADHFASEGFVVAGAPATEPFLVASVQEVATGLLLLVPFVGILVAMFAHEFLRSEVRERRPEISVWRAIGMTARQVRALLLARAAAIGLAGVLVGTGIGLLAQLALARSFDAPTIPFAAAAAGLWAACVAGAAWAGWSATRPGEPLSTEALR